MSSVHRVNYHLRAHKRDEFIEFIKALLLTPFVLHTTPLLSSSENEASSSRYCEILECIEELIEEHRKYQKLGTPEISKLFQMVPSIGKFFTSLPLKEAFLLNDKKRMISGRRHVPPSFNDIRHVLNTAQVIPTIKKFTNQVNAIASNLKLVTFDGDMTLYADGADFEHDTKLTGHLVRLLACGKYVAIVTAAGYGSDNKMYEKRLYGLLNAIEESQLAQECKERLYVFGGECNYLFNYDPLSRHLKFIPSSAYCDSESGILHSWFSFDDSIKNLLDNALECFRACASLMNLESDQYRIVTKTRAVGFIGNKLTREVLDEVALSTQRKLNQYQQINKGETQIPFCAFNGGSDVWVDIGNKFIGVSILEEYLGTKSEETLHIGDQFLSVGNDIATRSGCCTVWITSPSETEQVLAELESQLRVL